MPIEQMPLGDWREVIFLALMAGLMVGLWQVEWRRRAPAAAAGPLYHPPRPRAELPAEAPDAPAWHMHRMGLALHAQGQLADAERCYRAAIELDPLHRDAAFNLAVLLQDVGAWSQAAEAYARLLEHYPQDAAAHFNVGHVYFQLRLYRQAYRHWKAVIKLEPEARDVRANLRFLRMLRKRSRPRLQRA